MKPLSQKWKPIFSKAGFSGMLPTQMVVFWSEVEALEAEVNKYKMGEQKNVYKYIHRLCCEES